MSDQHDMFICHASEDKEQIVRPLAELLRLLGYQVWYDEFSLRPGDPLRKTIDLGLSQSAHGVVILSPNFVRKKWANLELDALVQLLAVGRVKRIIPVWHQVEVEDVAKISPLLAGIVGITTRLGIDEIARQIVEVLGPSKKQGSALPKGITRLGFAVPGTQVFMSRDLKMITLWRDGEMSDLIDAYKDHPLYRSNPKWHKKSWRKQLTHLVDIAGEHALYFYRMDFPPIQPMLISDDILKRVEAGEYFHMPMAAGSAGKLFGLDDPFYSHLTVLFSIKGEDRSRSLVVAPGPG